jgi:hypothetical protein
MNNTIIRFSIRRLLTAVLFVLTPLVLAQFAAAISSPSVSGTYAVVQQTSLGAHEQIRLRIHLVNHAPAPLNIQRMTLWDFSPPEKGGTETCNITLGSNASADTTQEFTIRRADYLMWQKGARPRLMLQVSGPGKALHKMVIRLAPNSTQEVR